MTVHYLKRKFGLVYRLNIRNKLDIFLLQVLPPEHKIIDFKLKSKKWRHTRSSFSNMPILISY